MGRGGKVGRVFRGTLQKLRQTYQETWGREWPYDDEYLSSEWRRALDAMPKTETGSYRWPMSEAYAMALMGMRENDTF
jgi:hypothetical protein